MRSISIQRPKNVVDLRQDRVGGLHIRLGERMGDAGHCGEQRHLQLQRGRFPDAAGNVLVQPGDPVA